MRTSVTAMALTLALAPVSAAIPSANADDLAKANVSLRPWARMTAPAFGCWMEKNLGHRDAFFNCGLKKYANKADPCIAGEGRKYYEGPAFPPALVTRVHPLATAIEVAFEHDALQRFNVALTGQFSEPEVRRAFDLPDEEERHQDVMRPVQDPAHPVIMSLDVEKCGEGKTCLMVQAFSHMGGADLDCPPPAAPRKP